jgi:hypothetical protein
MVEAQTVHLQEAVDDRGQLGVAQWVRHRVGMHAPYPCHQQEMIAAVAHPCQQARSIGDAGRRQLRENRCEPVRIALTIAQSAASSPVVQGT